MRRRRWLATSAALAMIPCTVFAQQKAAPIPRVAVLWVDSGDDSTNLVALREGLRAQGYIEGATVHLDRASLVDRYERLTDAVERLIAKKIDVIVCYGATATLAARKATAVVPIVSVTGANPVTIGVAESLSRPGGNVTGITFLHPDLDAKRLEVLHAIRPAIRRVAVVLNPSSATESANIRRWETAAARLNFEVRPVEIRLESDIDRVISQLPQQNIDAIAVVAGTLFFAHRMQIVAAITSSGLPAVYGSAEYVEAGGLVSYGPNVADGFREAAVLVAKILRGAKPAVIPFEQATKFELAINVRTAKALGIVTPQSILLRADKVFD